MKKGARCQDQKNLNLFQHTKARITVTEGPGGFVAIGFRPMISTQTARSAEENSRREKRSAPTVCKRSTIFERVSRFLKKGITG